MNKHSDQIINLHILITKAACLSNEIAEGFNRTITAKNAHMFGRKNAPFEVYTMLAHTLNQIAENIPLPDEEDMQ